MASTGRMPVGCGIYSYGIMLPSPVPATRNLDYSISPGIKWSASTRAIYAAADQARNRGYKMTVNSPLDGFKWYYYIINNQILGVLYINYLRILRTMSSDHSIPITELLFVV